MRRNWPLAATSLILISFSLFQTAMTQAQNSLQTRAERTNFAETTRYDEVIDFINEVQHRTPLATVEYFGASKEGRKLPLVILSNPPVRQPRDVRASDKPVVFVMANIHAGEVEGKEAVLNLLREIATGGEAARLLEKLVIIFAPIYNADGNEKIDINHRTEQNGPINGVGVRENADGFDLNRDYMKLETPEASALIRNVLNRWDPLVTVDLHTTDGSYHGYHLTYSPPLNPNVDAAILDYERNVMLPALTRTVAEKDHYRMYFYGNFMDEKFTNESNDLSKVWATFDSRPRFGNNYVGLRNRLAILSEAYSYADFKTRIDVTEKFVRSILFYSADHASDIMKLTADADAATTRQGLAPTANDKLGVAFERKASNNGKPVSILAGSVDKEIESRTGKARLKMTSKADPVMMMDYGEFSIARAEAIPAAYILRPDQKPIIEKLRAHGIAVAELTAETPLKVEAYIVENFTQSQRPFQKHKEAKVKVQREARQETFAPGSYVVSMAQPLGKLIFYLLEPESDDGLVTWNFFDAELGPQKVFPVYRVGQAVTVPQRQME